MSRLRIPAPTAGAAPLGSARADIRLITADGRQVIGWVGDGLRTEYAALPLDVDQVVDLAAQTDIAIPGGGPTYYEVRISTASRTEVYRVQVPDLPDIIELRDLVAAAAIPPGDLLDGRLLPTDATAGQSLVWDDALSRWVPTSVAPGSGIADAPLTGGPYGRQAGEWTGVAGVTHGHAIGDVTGLQTALDGKQAALVSGTSIKTVNGTTLLGAGDIAIAGGSGLELGETSTTAYRGDRGKTAYDHSQSAHAPADATAAGAAGDAFATSHLSAFDHGNIAHGETAYGWGNHASAGYLTSITYGTTAGTACEGNDARLGDARPPTAHTQAWSTITTTPTTLAGYGITDAVGSGDARLGDARTPLSHDHASNKLAQSSTHESADTDTGPTALHHTIGTSANQAAAGNHTHSGFVSVQLPRWRSALARQRDEGYSPRILWLGDSITCGCWATGAAFAGQRGQGFPSLALAASGLDYSEISFFGHLGAPPTYDPSDYYTGLSLGPGWEWSTFPSLSGYPARNISAAVGVDLTLPVPAEYDRVEVLWLRHTSTGYGQFEVRNGAGLLATVNTGSAASVGVGVTAVSTTLGSSPIVVRKSSSGYVQIIGIYAWRAGDIVSLMGGTSGRPLNGLLTQTVDPALGIGYQIAACNPDLIVLALGTNDRSLSIDQFLLDARSTALALATTRDVVVCLPPPGDWVVGPHASILRQGAAQGGCPVVDFFGALGYSYARANAAGLYTDTLHPSSAGHALLAAELARIDLFSVRPGV